MVVWRMRAITSLTLTRNGCKSADRGGEYLELDEFDEVREVDG
jgi:hypothetical protein